MLIVSVKLISQDFLYFLLAYLLGSIPTAVWVGKVFYEKDVREHGSKNAGATNTFRVLGTKAGVPVLLVDILKGFAAVKLVMFCSPLDEETALLFQIGLGVSALIGHVFPLFAGFRGGKGVATLLGLVLAIHPIACLISLVVFLITFFISKMVSLSSIIGTLVFPITIIILFKEDFLTLRIFAVLIPILVIITHKKNIRRLIHGEESKVNFARRQRDQ